MSGSIIPLDRAHRLLRKAQPYLTDLARFLADTHTAVSVLLDAMPHADGPTLLTLIPLVGYGGRDRALLPLYHLMLEKIGDETIRTAAAVQLGVAASLSNEVDDIRTRLIADLDHADPRIRCVCALALGWEGNTAAAAVLLNHLTDPDGDVQAAVVTALASLGDPALFSRLTHRMPTAAVDVRRSILLNLWRFQDRVEQVEKWYIETLPTIEAALRQDLLDGLAMLALSPAILELYRALLDDPDPRIRRQVLENLLASDAAALRPLIPLFQRYAMDQDPGVRRAAIRLLNNR